MNYCTKCGSIYTQPGTCNCFARGTTVTPPLPIQPITPTIPVTPWINPNPYPYPGGTTITFMAGDLSGNSMSVIAKAIEALPPIKIGPM